MKMIIEVCDACYHGKGKVRQATVLYESREVDEWLGACGEHGVLVAEMGLKTRPVPEPVEVSAP